MDQRDGRGRRMSPLMLSAEERTYLEKQARRRNLPRSRSERYRIILWCAKGLPNKTVGLKLGVHERTVGKWRQRFLNQGVEGLLDIARSGRPRTVDEHRIVAVMQRTLHSKPPTASRWTLRSMALATGFSQMTIHRIWTASGFNPRRTDATKFTGEP